jgi:TRAP-type C4-dicarboxylate transport system substrate-binding protein
MLLSGVALAAMGGAAGAETLRLSHQWSTQDVRHQVAQMIADEVAAAGVDLEIRIFPSAWLCCINLLTGAPPLSPSDVSRRAA